MITFKNGVFEICTPGASVSVESYSVTKYTPRPKQQQKMEPGAKSDYKLLKAGAGAAFVSVVSGLTAHAQAPGEKLGAAFEPVKELLIDLADPLCYVMFVWGCIECIVGRPASGIDRMKFAAIGFIAINWIPVVMDVIRGAAPSSS